MINSRDPTEPKTTHRKGKVRGLLDFIGSEEEENEDGADVTGDEGSLGLPGQLLNASTEAPLANIAELSAALAIVLAPRRKRGRPKKDAGWDADKARASIIWWHIRQRRAAGDFETERLSVHALIEEVKIYLNADKHFPKTTETNSLLQSVSRGRAKLSIGADWSSEYCEKMLSINNNR